MKNNKLLVTVLIIITTISLLGAIALVVVLKFTGSDKVEEVKEPTIDEIVEYSVDVPEITTNLISGDFVRIQFKIQTESIEAKEELEKRDFQVRNILIQELSEMNSEQFQGKEGIANLETILKDQVNELMHEGKVVRVYTTAFVLQ
ncbi:flagellar basal body-associated protein FliL [Bacillus sp. DJP31]|uniref:flagellar basal body-associated protein FliL n=1 Tax=Bacillus sp. DJP31 TaxID=3409789 RepID=UPI003BB549D4